MQPRVISRSQHPVSRKSIDSDALKVLYRLFRAGHTVYLVGGGVRDLILGRKPKDFDIATSARPSQIKRLFRNCRLVGRRFRLAHIQFGAGKVMEVSTFRREPDLEDCEREVDQDGTVDYYIRSDNTFGTPAEDAQRRDFTINSLFYDISNYSLIDYAGGVEDLRRGIICTIGEPNLRFQEDPVRMIRAIKFCARLGFKMDKATWEGIVCNRQSISNASPPRIQEEIIRLVESGSARRSFELLDDSGLLEDLVPELFAYIGEAENGGVESDKDGQLFFRLMEEVDNHKTPLERSLLYAVLMLPLALNVGLLMDGVTEEVYREVVKTLASRFGICRRTQERCMQAYMAVRRMIGQRAKQTVPRGFFSRGVVADAMVLCRFLANAGVADSETLAWWEGKYAEYKNRAVANGEGEERIQRGSSTGRSPKRYVRSRGSRGGRQNDSATPDGVAKQGEER